MKQRCFCPVTTEILSRQNIHSLHKSKQSLSRNCKCLLLFYNQGHILKILAGYRTWCKMFLLLLFYYYYFKDMIYPMCCIHYTLLLWFLLCSCKRNADIIFWKIDAYVALGVHCGSADCLFTFLTVRRFLVIWLLAAQ